MKLPKRLAALAVLAAAVALPAIAQVAGAKPGQSPAQTAAQAASKAPTVTSTTTPHAPASPEERAARFDKADVNKDGKLTKAEFSAALPVARQNRADKIWARINPTGKDSLTKAEYLAAPMGHGKSAAKAS